MWSDVKEQVSTLEHAELVRLIRELYKLTVSNQNFLNTRFGPSDLKPYIETIDDCMYPAGRRQDWSVKVALAKRAIREFTKAKPSDHQGAAELKTYFIERGIEFCIDHGYFHEPLCQAFLRMYISAIDTIQKVPREHQDGFRRRLRALVNSIGEIHEAFEDAFRDQYENSFAEE